MQRELRTIDLNRTESLRNSAMSFAGENIDLSMTKEDDLISRLNRKDQEILSLSKQLRQLEIENRLLNKESKPDVALLKKTGELEYKINLLLNENEKLNAFMGERINQIEKQKHLLELKEKEKQDLINEKDAMDKCHQTTLIAQKNEFIKQIQSISTENAQLNAQLALIREKTHDNSKQLLTERNSIIVEKDHELQEMHIRFNELEKQCHFQKQQIDDLETHMQQNTEVCEDIQQIYQEQLNIREKQLTEKHESEKLELMSQLGESQNFITELQNHLNDIHKQISKFKEEKLQLKLQNQQLQQRINELEDEVQNNYNLPQFTMSETTTEHSLEEKKPQTKLNCINQLKQYSLSSYQQQFQQKLQKTKEQSPLKNLETFGNRPVSCLSIVKNLNNDYDEEDDSISPIEMFKQWKKSVAERKH